MHLSKHIIYMCSYCNVHRRARALICAHRNTYIEQGPFSPITFWSEFKFYGKLVYRDSIIGHQIVSNCHTCHGSSAVVSCVKLWNCHFVRIEITVKYHRSRCIQKHNQAKNKNIVSNLQCWSFVRRIHTSPVNFPRKRPILRKIFPCHDWRNRDYVSLLIIVKNVVCRFSLFNTFQLPQLTALVQKPCLSFRAFIIFYTINFNITNCTHLYDTCFCSGCARNALR